MKRSDNHRGDKSVDLYSQGIQRVPRSVWQQVNLEQLNLADNQLAQIPEQIGNLTKLQMLDLGHNELFRLTSVT